MMWDQRINIVVMLTKTMEGSKVCSNVHRHTDTLSPAGLLVLGGFRPDLCMQTIRIGPIAIAIPFEEGLAKPMPV